MGVTCAGAVVVGFGVHPAVVREFVVIPNGDHGKAFVHGLQAGIGAIFFVQIAIVGKGGGVLAATGKRSAVGEHQRIVAAFDTATLKIFAHSLVNVIAQMNKKV